MRKNATKLAAAVLSLAMVMTSVNMPASAAKTKVKLNKTKATLYVNGSASEKATTLKVTVNGKKVNATFKSSNTKVLTVAKKTGKVTAKKNGTAKVTATYKKKKYNCTVTVKTYATSVSITSAKTLNLAAGKTATINATVKPSTASNKKVSFASSDKNVATVTSAGKVTAKKAGTATVTVKALGSKKAAKKATVKVNVKAAAKPTTEPTTEPTTTPTTAPTATPETPVATEGAITVTTNVTGAAVKVLDGDKVITTAVGSELDKTVVTGKIPYGTYTVVVSKDGYNDVKKTVVVNGDVTLEAVTLTAANEMKAEAIGAKKIKVTFTNEIDTAKAKFTLKKGNVTANIAEPVFAADKKSAVIELSSKISAGEYTVNVSGVNSKDITLKFTGEDEKVAKISFKSDKAVLDADDTKKVTIGYKVENQYGEDITKATALKANASVVLEDNKESIDASNGVVTIDDMKTEAKEGDKIVVTLVHVESGVSANVTATVSAKSQVAEVTIDKIYNADEKAVLSEDTDDASEFMLLVSVKDQYGNALTAKEAKRDLLVNMTDASIVSVDGYDSSANSATFSTVSINDEKYVALKLAKVKASDGSGSLKAGKNTITLISKATGKNASKVVEVQAGSKVDKFTMSAPELAVAGESVKVPFEALNLSGETVDKVSVLKKVKISTSQDKNNTSLATFEVNAVTGKPELNVDLKDVEKGKLTITAMTETNKVSTLTIDVKDAAKPVAIVGLDSSVNTNVLVNDANQSNKIEFTLDKLKAEDQYGRQYNANHFTSIGSEYTITAATSGAISAKDSTFNISATGSQDLTKLDTSKTMTITPNAKSGSETVNFKLVDKNGKAVAGSDVDLTFKAVKQSDIVSYDMDDIGKMYDEVGNGQTDAAAYTKKLSVYGLLKNGSKVEVNNNYFKVKTDNKALVSTADTTTKTVNTINVSSAATYADNTSEVTANVTVTIGATGDTLTKKVVISKEAPKLASATFNADLPEVNVVDGKAVVGNSSIKVATAGAILGYVKVVDQYGAVGSIDATDANTGIITFADTSKTTVPAIVTFSSLPTNAKVTDNGTEKAKITDLAAGDVFNAKVTFAGDVTISAKVIVK